MKLAKTLHFLNQRRVYYTAPAYNLPCLSSEVGCKDTLFMDKLASFRILLCFAVGPRIILTHFFL